MLIIKWMLVLAKKDTLYMQALVSLSVKVSTVACLWRVKREAAEGTIYLPSINIKL